jgi:phosphoglycerate kinase
MYSRNLPFDPVRPYGVVLGGSKVSDKIGVISNLLGKVDVMAIGGGMLFTFLAAQGKEIGTSLVEPRSHRYSQGIDQAGSRL